MVSNQMMKTVVEFNKSTFESAFKTLAILEGYTEKNVSGSLNSDCLISDNQKTIWEPLVKQCKDNRNELKKSIDRGYDLMISFFE